MPSLLGREFDDCVKLFRKKFAPNCGLPIHVRSRNGVSLDGHVCDAIKEFKPGKSWTIIIDRGCPDPIDALIHEWAHVLTDEKLGWSSDHDSQHSNEWGVMYATLYRAYHNIYSGGDDVKSIDQRNH